MSPWKMKINRVITKAKWDPCFIRWVSSLTWRARGLWGGWDESVREGKKEGVE